MKLIWEWRGGDYIPLLYLEQCGVTCCFLRLLFSCYYFCGGFVLVFLSAKAGMDVEFKYLKVDASSMGSGFSGAIGRRGCQRCSRLYPVVICLYVFIAFGIVCF